MKKFQVLAGIASTVAIASSIAIGDAASAFPCSYNKSGGGGAQSSSGPTILGSGGSDRMNPWKSYKTAGLGFLGLAGILGAGAGYMSYRAGQRASAACAAMSDSFEVFEEPIADAGVTEPADAVAGVREHPEAPGGELDLPRAQVADVSAESAIEEGESAIVK
jgi:drug/metabolite transporter (DMT)-like permease